MHYPLDLVSTINRFDWIQKNYDPRKVIYMGDGIFDHYVMKQAGYSIAPSNSDQNAKKYANYVSKRAGVIAVAEACIHILERFFEYNDPESLTTIKDNTLGEWAVRI